MSDKIYTIYRLKFPGNEVYIGKTYRSLNIRWDNGNAYNGEVRKAIDKYGWENVEKEILYENIVKEEASRLEAEEVTKHGGVNHPLVLNIQTGGDSGWTYSDAMKKKMSEKVKQLYKDHPEILQKMVENRKKTLEEHPEIREKMSENIRKAYQEHPEIREKLSENLKKFREENPEAYDFQKIKVDQYSYDGSKLIATYNSINDAERSTGIYGTAITKCMKRKAISAGGFRWIEHGKHFGIIEYPVCTNEKVQIAQIDANTGKIVNVYESMAKAAAETGIAISSISMCVNDKLNHAGGYKWKRIA